MLLLLLNRTVRPRKGVRVGLDVSLMVLLPLSTLLGLPFQYISLIDDIPHRDTGPVLISRRPLTEDGEG